MAIRYEESKIDSPKQWDVLNIDITSGSSVNWGISQALMSPVLRLMVQAKIDELLPGQEHLTFNNFKKLVFYLHKNKYDTSDISTGVRQALEHTFGDQLFVDAANEKEVREEEMAGAFDPDLVRDLQQTLYSFASPNLPFSIIIDGNWGPLTQRALDYILDSYHIPKQEPSASLNRQLKTISSRVVRLRCSNWALVDAIEHNPFCIIHQDSRELTLVKDQKGASILRNRDKAKLFHFPGILNKSYIVTQQFLSYSAWFMLLCMKGQQSYDQFCDLLVRTGDDHWEIIGASSAESRKEFVQTPDHELSFEERENALLHIHCITKTNYDIKLIGVYFSGQIKFQLLEGDEATEQPQAGKQLLFSLGSFFEQPAEDQNAQIVPLAKADFVKIFIVRKSRIHVTGKSEPVFSVTGFPDEFYQLITAKEEDILATLTFGVDFYKRIPDFSQFKSKVEERYAYKPVIVRDDLQKSRWGSQKVNNGLQLSAYVSKAMIPGFYTVRATVHSLKEEEPLEGPVAFFLDDSLPNEIEYVQAENGVASLTINNCNEAFTLGAYTSNGTELELDLNEEKGLPKGFYWDRSSSFRDRVNDMYDQKEIIEKDDLQKHRWGGLSAVNGKRLSATVSDSWLPGFYAVHLQVSAEGARPLKGEVAFFLHNTFSREIRFVHIKDGVAELKVKAYEAFTVGAYTEDGTMLELDLNGVDGWPEGFYYESKQEEDKPKNKDYRFDMTEELPAAHIVYNDVKEAFGPFVSTREKHELSLPSAFKVGKYLVTNEFYFDFIQDGGYQNDAFWNVDEETRKHFLCENQKSVGPASWFSFEEYPFSKSKHPVTGISYQEAKAFCNWLNKIHKPEHGWAWCLPTEDMWEFAARGKEGRLYPWGFDFIPGYCNSAESNLNTVSGIFDFESGKSKYGCLDMAGNVWEFVQTQDANPPWCVLKGGSFKNNQQEVRSHLRLFSVPLEMRALDFGFRCAQVYMEREM